MAMRFFRNRRNSMISMVVFGFIILTFIFWGYYETEQQSSLGSLTTVNGERISQGEFQFMLNSRLESYGQLLGAAGPRNRELVDFIEGQVAVELVRRKAVAHAARRLGIMVGPEDILAEISRYEAFKDPNTQSFSPRLYRLILESNRLEPRIFERAIAEDLANARLQSLLDSSVRVSEREVLEALELQDFRFRLQSARLSQQNLERHANLSASEEELREFFQSRAAQFTQPEKRRLRIARFDIVEAKRQSEISEQEKQAFYSSQVEDSLDPRWTEERVRALHILISDSGSSGRREAQRIFRDLEREKSSSSPQDFEEFFRQMAKTNSEDYTSAFRGGDSGYVSRGESIEEIDEALFSAGSGDLLGPLQTGFGFHLFYVLDRSSDQNSFENRRLEIKSLLQEQALESQKEKLVSRIRSQVSGRNQDFSPLLEELGFSVLVTDPIDLSAREALLPFAVLQKAFAAPVLQWQSPEEFEDSLFVFRTDEVLEAQPMSFEEAREQVESLLMAERIDQFVQNIAIELQTGEREWESLRALGAQTRDNPDFRVFQAEEIPGFGRSEIIQRQAQSLSEHSPLKGPIYFREDFVFLRGTEFVGSDESDFSEEDRANMREELLLARRATLIRDFSRNALESARIPKDFRQAHNL